MNDFNELILNLMSCFDQKRYFDTDPTSSVSDSKAVEAFSDVEKFCVSV